MQSVRSEQAIIGGVGATRIDTYSINKLQTIQKETKDACVRSAAMIVYDRFGVIFAQSCCFPLA